MTTPDGLRGDRVPHLRGNPSILEHIGCLRPPFLVRSSGLLSLPGKSSLSLRGEAVLDGPRLQREAPFC